MTEHKKLRETEKRKVTHDAFPLIIKFLYVTTILNFSIYFEYSF